MEVTNIHAVLTQVPPNTNKLLKTTINYKSWKFVTFSFQVKSLKINDSKEDLYIE